MEIRWKRDSKGQMICAVGVWIKGSNHGEGLAETRGTRVTAPTRTQILNPAWWDSTSGLWWLQQEGMYLPRPFQSMTSREAEVPLKLVNLRVYPHLLSPFVNKAPKPGSSLPSYFIS